MTQALIITAPGINCDLELAEAFSLAGAEPRYVHLNELLENPSIIDEVDLIGLPGGFSYGDDLGAGVIFSGHLRDQLHDSVHEFLQSDTLILGICNGFQVLVESGIFEPDEPAGERSVALYSNASNHYECRWVELESADCCCPWLEAGERMPVPVAHAEGRFVVRDDAVMQRLIAGRQVALRYVRPGWVDSPDGGDDSVPYPYNPNGAAGDVAGICDPSGRVLGLMPHPERNLDPWNHPHWTRHGADMGPREVGEGLAFYRRMVEVAESALV